MPTSYPEDDLADGRAALLSGWSTGSEPGLVITRTSGALVWDAKGNEYIDCTSMAWSNNIGASHPEVVEAAFAQARQLSHLRSNFDSIPLLLLAKAMTDAAPGDLKRIGFTLHGSLAVEMAIKLASCWPRCFPCTASSAGKAQRTWPRRPTTPGR
jgi:4-aminobutyrate aminotransferase/(S)-3-amino-2-methylpropionate transaminase